MKCVISHCHYRCFLLLCVLVEVSSPAAVHTWPLVAPGLYKMLPDTRFFGRSRAAGSSWGQRAAEDAQACAALCEADAACQSWTYDEAHTTWKGAFLNVCDLMMHTAPSQSHAFGFMSGYKGQRVGLGMFLYQFCWCCGMRNSSHAYWTSLASNSALWACQFYWRAKRSIEIRSQSRLSAPVLLAR